MKQDKKYIILNWKMNFTVSESIEFSNNIIKTLSGFKNKNIEIIICPTYMSLPYCYQILSSFVKLGAQNISHTDDVNGSFTGEISAKMISDYAEYVILGHSERRNHLNEKNSDINKKRLFSIQNEINPIICVGEDTNVRNSDKHIDFLKGQIKESITSDYKNKIVAYEPVWAIGTGRSANIRDIETTHTLIRKLLFKRINDAKSEIKILYGGSVSPQNAKEILDAENVDGALVGGASLSAKKFIEICRTI